MLDMPVTLPIYVAPAAMAKLGHPLGEINITRAAGKAGIIQGVRALRDQLHQRQSDFIAQMPFFRIDLFQR
jgi:isopentenyl diphosphate isomerase/L-lactate dehydrogenase-like FMN-dependent dehydrogenase